MTEPRDLRDLVGDVSAEELEELREVDALLRSVDARPRSLPPAIVRPPAQHRLRTRSRTLGRLVIAAALVAAVAGLSFAAALWMAPRDGFDARATIPLEATANAPGAAATIRLGERDPSGTWEVELTVSGLRELPPGGFYILWLAKEGQYAGTCGSFRVTGETQTFRWDVAYRLDDYDEWVISARPPGLPRDPKVRPWLLHARIRT